MMMWKIVRVLKASVLYIYIDYAKLLYPIAQNFNISKFFFKHCHLLPSLLTEEKIIKIIKRKRITMIFLLQTT